MTWRRAKRVRVHTVEHHPQITSPSVEGLLVGQTRREYVLAVPQVLMAPNVDPVSLDEARFLRIPREQVLFYEVLA